MDDYLESLELQRKVNALFKKYEGVEGEIAYKGWGNDEEFQTVCRLEWTVVTKKWIEHLKMYDANHDYIN